jgi:integrase
LRIGEALALRWQHVDLATGTLHVVDAKTAAGIRSVDLTLALREELVLWRTESRLDRAGRLRARDGDRTQAQPVEPESRRAPAGDRRS